MRWRVLLDKNFTIALLDQTIDLSAQSSGTVTIEVLHSASVSVVYNHSNNKVCTNLTVHFIVHDYAKSDFLLVSKDANDLVCKVIIDLVGKSAFGSVKAVVSTNKDCSHALITEQLHKGINTESVVRIRATADKKSIHSFNGLIRLEPSSVGASAQQEHKVLLLDPTAHVTSVPSLQVLHDQVTCGHASALCPINQDDITALQLKGIEESYAKLLIIQGFLDQ